MWKNICGKERRGGKKRREGEKILSAVSLLLIDPALEKKESRKQRHTLALPGKMKHKSGRRGGAGCCFSGSLYISWFMGYSQHLIRPAPSVPTCTAPGEHQSGIKQIIQCVGETSSIPKKYFMLHLHHPSTHQWTVHSVYSSLIIGLVPCGKIFKKSRCISRKKKKKGENRKSAWRVTVRLTSQSIYWLFYWT